MVRRENAKCYGDQCTFKATRQALSSPALTTYVRYKHLRGKRKRGRKRVDTGKKRAGGYAIRALTRTLAQDFPRWPGCFPATQQQNKAAENTRKREHSVQAKALPAKEGEKFFLVEEARTSQAANLNARFVSTRLIPKQRGRVDCQCFNCCSVCADLDFLYLCPPDTTAFLSQSCCVKEEWSRRNMESRWLHQALCHFHS